MSEPESPLLTRALIAYVGYGASRTPAANDAAVLVLARTDGAQLLDMVKRIVRASDSLVIPREAFGRENKSILFSREFEKIWPGLTTEALYALSWRWSYNAFF